MDKLPARRIRRIAVYCGSNVGKGDAYTQAAAELGAEIARRGIGIVYGGTHKGLMGALADAALAAGGDVHGVITERLAGLGHLHPAITSHEIVAGMRARKTKMADMADAFIAMPGGIGTTEEFVEVWTLNQLGYFDKPVGLLDVEGFFQPFLRFIDEMVERLFLPAAHRDSLVVHAGAADLVGGLITAPALSGSKWM
ncbi:MAG: TIGR00730 family Rossman fold protein [Flavobacteriaceae bacterium]